MNQSDPAAALRELITKAQSDPLRMTLTTIASVCGVDYSRLWRFTRKNKPARTLLLDEAERISTKLTALTELFHVQD